MNTHDEELITQVVTSEHRSWRPNAKYEVSYSGADWNDNSELVTFTVECGGFRFHDWLTADNARDLIKGMQQILDRSMEDEGAES